MLIWFQHTWTELNWIHKVCLLFDTVPYFFALHLDVFSAIFDTFWWIFPIPSCTKERREKITHKQSSEISITERLHIWFLAVLLHFDFCLCCAVLCCIDTKAHYCTSCIRCTMRTKRNQQLSAHSKFICALCISMQSILFIILSLLDAVASSPPRIIWKYAEFFLPLSCFIIRICKQMEREVSVDCFMNDGWKEFLFLETKKKHAHSEEKKSTRLEHLSYSFVCTDKINTKRIKETELPMRERKIHYGCLPQVR